MTPSNGGAEQFVNWDGGIDLKFYSDEKFDEKISPHSLVVGSTFYYAIEWAHVFTAAMPVQFYATECTVSDPNTPSLTFAVIQNGCLSEVVVTDRISGVYAQDILKFSYKSFTFTHGLGSFNLLLSCNIGFCLKDDITKGDCGYDPTACKAGYAP